MSKTGLKNMRQRNGRYILFGYKATWVGFEQYDVIHGGQVLDKLVDSSAEPKLKNLNFRSPCDDRAHIVDHINLVAE